MFDQTFVNTGAPTRKPWTVAASFAVQGIAISAAVILPILHPAILQPKIDPPLWVHLQPVQKIIPAEATHTTASRRTTILKPFVTPTKVPDGKPRQIADTDFGDSVPNVFPVPGPGSGTIGGGSDIFSTLLPASRPPEPAKVVKPAPPAAPAGPIAVSSTIQSAKLLFGPKPIYPSLAKAARVQGTVRIQAIIGADGSISSLHVLSGPPLLIPAAKDAVSRWRYQATMLNGRAVDVITEIDVIFTLGGN